MNFYNEFDPFAAAWLRKLIEAGHIAPGVVDERSIKDIQPDELKQYTQCHFFAGIGVWSYALRQAGWPADRPVWTGSCPCQPFSTAGQRKGTEDERHLWPTWFRLVRECKPVTVFGEQVEAAIRQGWLDIVQTDLEGIGYTLGAVGFPACGLGAPHIRQRLYFVADSSGARPLPGTYPGIYSRKESPGSRNGESERQSSVSHLGDSTDQGLSLRTSQALSGKDSRGIAERPSNAVNGFWRDAEWIYCRDEKYRAVEPGTFPLAHGATNRVGRLRGYGNALVAPCAEAFIRAYLETESEGS